RSPSTAGPTTDACTPPLHDARPISTTGAQTYNDPVTLGANATLTSTGGGSIAFGGTVNGAFGLAVSTGGVTTFGGAVGGTTALASGRAQAGTAGISSGRRPATAGAQ